MAEQGTSQENSLPDLYEIWNYSEPANTRSRFEEIQSKLSESSDVSYSLELQTQIARTYSLERTFDKAHAILDAVESQLTESLVLVRIRYLLERGRTFNSAGDKSKALVLFEEAYALGVKASEDFYAVDAAHMVAIAISDADDKERWNLIGVALAESSKNARARNWLGSLYNNLGWDYFGQERYAEALTKFEEALAYRLEGSDVERTNIAYWCVAKGYRFVDRVDEALVIQERLLRENKASGNSDGYVFEELGELHLLKNDMEQSRIYFAEAYYELVKDSWLVENESAQLERLKTLGGVEES